MRNEVGRLAMLEFATMVVYTVVLAASGYYFMQKYDDDSHHGLSVWRQPFLVAMIAIGGIPLAITYVVLEYVL